METDAHSPARVGADNDPGVAAAPLGTDDEAAGAHTRPPVAANANDRAIGSRPANTRGGVPITVILICVLVVAAAFALFTILGGAA